jgi:murein DD-endopeptidase MepM/ murein hydrolase activator NlpD
LDHFKPRGSHRGRAAPDLVDLGDDPPLTVDGVSGTAIDRRRISLHWYSGIVLNGLCGAALMGGAVYIALDGQAFFASTPERIEVLRGTLAGGESAAGTLRKTDKLQSPAEVHTARQTIRVSSIVKIGEREVVRVRPFIHVATDLALSTSELSADIPRFNQARLLANASKPNGTAAPDDTPMDAAPAEAAPAAAAEAAEDADVSFVLRDLAPVLPNAKLDGALSSDEVLTRVREAANWTVGARTAAAGATPAGHAPLAYAPSDGGADPYAGFGTRIVPENITLLPKTAAEITGGNPWNERTVTAKKGESATSILRDLGASTDEAEAIAALLGPRGREGGLKDGQKLRILLSPVGGKATQREQPVRVMVMGETAPEAVVALSDTGQYVQVDAESADTQIAQQDEEDVDETNGPRLYQSIYETALRQQVPRPVIEQLIRVYSYDVDFQRRVQPGDSFEILYPADDETGAEGKSEVWFASLTIGGEIKRYYRFVTPDDNAVDYYDESGKSAKKFLVRKPVEQAIMRSPYGWRRHPVLGYSKMHTGVDWAAPRGTPIAAAGDGVVEKASWDGGYGRYVKIKHRYGYETAYGHMSAFARGIVPGTHVRQGQVIGYVGSTGLSTGPHVHFEILVNGRFVDPNRIKLPRGRSLEGPVLANFEKKREEIDGILSRAANRTAAVTPPPATRMPRREAAARR